MDIEQLRTYLEECSKLLNSNNVISDREAEFRSGKFLEAQYHIASGVRELSSEFLKTNSLQSVTYAQVLSADDSKNVTEKKIKTEANPTYIIVREKYDETEADLTYLKTMSKVFADAHVFYRQLARGESTYVKV